MEVLSIEYALLAMQAALLDEVTSQLRAVVINLDKDEEVLYSHFYYDGEASEKQVDLWDCVVCEASASLGINCFVKTKIKRLDFPQKIPLEGYFAYLRKESEELNPKSELCKPEIKESSIGYALLAVQYTMLGTVTPELRAVIVDFDKDEPLLYIRFYYDGEVSEKIISFWQNAIRESRIDFGSSCRLDGKVERIDFPETFPFRGRFGYVRKE